MWDMLAGLFSQEGMRDAAVSASSGAAGRNDGLVGQGMGQHTLLGLESGTPTHDPLKELLALSQPSKGRRNLPASFMDLLGYDLLTGPRQSGPPVGLLGGGRADHNPGPQLGSGWPSSSSNELEDLLKALQRMSK